MTNLDDIMATIIERFDKIDATIEGINKRLRQNDWKIEKEVKDAKD